MAKARKGFLKMNEQQFGNKVRQDVAKVKKDISTLVGDGTVQLGRLENNLSHATGDLTTWVGDGVSDLSDGIDKVTGDARDRVVHATATIKKDVRHGLGQFNSTAQKYADRVPGDFGKQAARYPWVSISIALMMGFIVGFVLKPTRLQV
jgi:hypothetical protein